MAYVVKVKNIDTSDHTYHGYILEPNDEKTLSEEERILWSEDDSVLDDISSDKLQVGDGTTYLTTTNEQLNWLKQVDTNPKALDDKHIYQTTPRKIGTYTYFTGADDDHTDPLKYGGNSNTNCACFTHSVGGSNPEVIYLEFNCISNDTYIREGYLSFKDCVHDKLTLEVVPKTTTYTTGGTNTNYNLYGGYLIIPAAGNGTITISDSDRVLVECVENEFGTKPAGYWNADFNSTTKTFENITAASSGDGDYNMFGTEIIFSRFANNISCLGNGALRLTSDDISQIGHNMRIKLSGHTYGTDHEWHASVNLTLYRKYTV